MSESSTDTTTVNEIEVEIPMSAKINMLLRLILFPPAMTLFLHLPANDWGWVDGWLFIGAFALVAIIGGFWLMKSNPKLFMERMKGSYQEDQKQEDSLIVTILSLSMLAIFPVAALDYRNDWLTMNNIISKIFGWILLFISFYILYRVMKENTFLSRSVVVQKERKQKVIDTGFYSLIRHPMYFGIVFMLTSIAFILGSAVSFIPILISIALLYLRASSEEKLLAEELEGYEAYTRKVKKRLIPYII